MIGVIDYGAGNLANVMNAMNHLNIQASIASDPAEIKSFTGLIIPGVGAFGPAMDRIRQKKLDQPIIEQAGSGIPVLGICLGMQLLLTESEENGNHSGLNLIPGKVKKFESSLKIPQIGWNNLIFRNGSRLTDGIESGSYAYFVHSYYCEPYEKQDLVADSDYGGNFAAVIGRGNIFGTQFHPEKSQNTGLRILQNFGEMTL